jgi:phosphodiesterase/alkaline phosphatase D-like protein
MIPMLRPRLLLVPLAALGALLLFASAASANKFTLGVSAGDVTQNSAILWAHTQKAGKVGLELSQGAIGRCPKKGKLPKPTTKSKKSRDFTVHKTIKKLTPGKSYIYRFCLAGGKASAIGHFDTAPKPNQNKTIKFAVSGDQDAQPAPGQTKPYWDSNFKILADMQKENNNFNLDMGDTIYSDTEVPGVTDLAVTKQQKWAKYRMNLGQKAWANLRGATSYYGHWDDHEFMNDFAPGESSFDGGKVQVAPPTLYNDSKAAFLDYSPTGWNPQTGLYKTARWGKNVEAFFLDERSFRSNEVNYQSSVCNNPMTGQPDDFPTAPQSFRDRFVVIRPDLAQPVSPACVAAINDPNRTMLGAAQLAKFESDIKSSTATWKVIFNEVPIQQFYAAPYDRWEGYGAERTQLLNFLKDNVKNAVFLTTDIHANLVNDARLATLEPGGPVNSGIMDITTGPVATKSYAHEVDDVTKGGAGVLYSQVFKPQPPSGVGMSCAAMDQFSYAEVKANASQLTVDLKNEARKPVVETNGPAQGTDNSAPTNAAGTCGQIVLNAK